MIILERLGFGPFFNQTLNQLLILHRCTVIHVNPSFIFLVSETGVVTTIRSLCGTITPADATIRVNSTTNRLKLVLEEDQDNDRPTFDAYVYVLPTFKGRFTLIHVLTCSPKPEPGYLILIYLGQSAKLRQNNTKGEGKGCVFLMNRKFCYFEIDRFSQENKKKGKQQTTIIKESYLDIYFLADVELVPSLLLNPDGCLVILYQNAGESDLFNSPGFANPYSP